MLPNDGVAIAERGGYGNNDDDGGGTELVRITDA